MTVARTAILASERLRQTIVQGDVAAAGTTQADATQLTANWVKVSTIAAGAGVKLPIAVAGREVTVVAADYATQNDLNVYAFSGDAMGPVIDGIVVLAGDRLSAARFLCFTTGIWDIADSHGSLRAPDRASFIGAGAISVPAVRRAIALGSLAGRGTCTASAH